MVEHIIRNDGVRGSSPLSGTIPLTLLLERLLLEVRNCACARGYGVGGGLLRGQGVGCIPLDINPGTAKRIEASSQKGIYPSLRHRFAKVAK